MTEGSASSTRPVGSLALWQIVAAALLLLLLLWAAWITHTLLELQNRKIVSVALNQLVNEFVLAESRHGSSPDASAARTRLYLEALDRAVAELEADGHVVLVREAVLGRRIPDETARLRRAVKMRLAGGM